jgi:hypothetical protein
MFKILMTSRGYLRIPMTLGALESMTDEEKVALLLGNDRNAEFTADDSEILNEAITIMFELELGQ